MSDYQMIDDRVLVRPIEQASMTPGGIALPDTAKEKPNRGLVVAVGPGRLNPEGYRVALMIREGDVVVYSRYAGSDLHLDGEDYRCLTESEVYLIEKRGQKA